MEFIADSVRVVKDLILNQVARISPAYFMHLTHETGRGPSAGESAQDIADYFHKSFDEYLEFLGATPEDVAQKVILEYGPGDILGVALLFAAYGASKVYCVDRFSLLSPGPFNIEVMRLLIAKLEGKVRQRAKVCFIAMGDPGSGFKPDVIEYIVRPNGLSGMKAEVDWVLSRAVLEHVNDLEGTFRDMAHYLRVGGLAAHLVDLQSHGMHRRNPLDFLKWSPLMWNQMHSHKGVPNRWRIDRYRDIVRMLPFELMKLQTIKVADPTHVSAIRSRLARRFHHLSDEELSCLLFWIVCRKRDQEELSRRVD